MNILIHAHEHAFDGNCIIANIVKIMTAAMSSVYMFLVVKQLRLLVCLFRSFFAGCA